MNPVVIDCYELNASQLYANAELELFKGAFDALDVVFSEVSFGLKSGANFFVSHIALIFWHFLFFCWILAGLDSRSWSFSSILGCMMVFQPRLAVLV